MKRSVTAILLTFSPSILKAEGQTLLPYFIDTFYLAAILLVWFVVIKIGIWLYELLKKEKLYHKHKILIWTTTGLISLFIWSMVKYDPYPYEGPIDSIFKSYSKNSKANLEGQTEYNFQDSTVYTWRNGERVIVRKLTDEEIKTWKFEEAQ